MPFEASKVATAMVRNAAGQSILYVIGGAGPPYGFSVDRVQAYNVATNTWSQKARLPYAQYGSNGTGVINGKIYFSGGIYNDPEEWGPSALLFVYDPTPNRWTRKAYMPEPGATGVTGVIQGRLYVVSTCYEPIPFEEEYGPCGEVEGGRPGVSNFFRYDPVSNRWTRLPSPKGEYHMGDVLDKKLYVTDGKKLEAYDPVTNQWTTKAPGPQVRYRAAATAQGSRLYLIGGRQLTGTGWQAIRTTRVYNPTTDSWTTAAPMPTAREDITASKVFLNGQPGIEVVGGSAPGNNLQYIP
jgi:N-acetylneuraminic acid mutarotase